VDPVLDTSVRPVSSAGLKLAEGALICECGQAVTPGSSTQPETTRPDLRSPDMAYGLAEQE
jgi:hypothetical protein